MIEALLIGVGGDFFESSKVEADGLSRGRLIVDLLILIEDGRCDPLALFFPVRGSISRLRVGSPCWLLSASLALTPCHMSTRGPPIMADIDASALEFFALYPEKFVAVDPSRTFRVLIVEEMRIVAGPLVTRFHAVNATARGRMGPVQVQQTIVLTRSTNVAVFASEDARRWQ
jgi:hypothetical protein